MTYQERLRRAMYESEYDTPTKLAKKIGATSQGIGMVLSGKSKSLSSKYESKACSALGISTEWLANNAGPMRPVKIPNYTLEAERGEIVLEVELIEAFRRLPMQDKARLVLDTKYKADLADLERKAAIPDDPRPKTNAA